MNILQGDCLEVLKTLPECSVQCVVTSPPYYGLRDYGTATWEGGDADCDHLEPKGSTIGMKSDTFHGSNTQEAHYIAYKNTCKKCGAIRIDDQIGLEETPEKYVEKMVQVFREIKRVLKDDGVAWLNLGDSYATRHANGTKDDDTGWSHGEISQGYQARAGGLGNGVKPKDLIGIPWMVAFALRADGWWLRQDIIWHKPNPMPESVTDRCTKAHEYIFLLTKSARYYYDHEAIKEPSKDPVDDRGARAAEEHKRFPTEKVNGIRASGVYPKRNKRSVWTVTTKPYKEAHFATFPPDLIEPCILAGSKESDTVLDPFNGSGTTGEVSLKHKRDYIGIDLNPDYIELTHKRLAEVEVRLF